MSDHLVIVKYSIIQYDDFMSHVDGKGPFLGIFVDNLERTILRKDVVNIPLLVKDLEDKLQQFDLKNTIVLGHPAHWSSNNYARTRSGFLETRYHAKFSKAQKKELKRRFGYLGFIF
jgi:hypothetical protein